MSKAHTIPLRTAGIGVMLLMIQACGSSSVSPGGQPVTTNSSCVTDFACPNGSECGSGGCEAVAPGIYPHIQTASAIFREYLDNDEVSWRAAHYDLLIGRLEYYADDIRDINPDARLFEYVNMRYHRWDEDGTATDWAIANGYDPEDFYLHFRTDTEVPTWEGTTLVPGFPPGIVPGWNPDADPDDPPASAATRAESRVYGYDEGPHEPWYMVNITDDGLRDFLFDWVVSMMDGSVANQTFAYGPLDGFVADNAIYYPLFGEGVLDRTTEFYEQPLDDDHPYAVGFETVYPELAERLRDHFGQTIDIMPNYGHISFTSYNNRSARNVRLSTPWIWGEVWLMYRGYGAPTTGSQRAITYDIDYEQAIAEVVRQTRQGARRVLGARDLVGLGAGSDRGRLFTLGLYYLTHNENTFYLYETLNGHAGAGHLSEWQWNPAVEFNVGAPDHIPAGAVDFDGNANTDEHYVFASGADPVNPALTYRVLARNFTNALVLVKMLPSGSHVNDNSITTHALDGSYAPLLADGTLGPVVTEASIRNNEALILIPVD